MSSTVPSIASRLTAADGTSSGARHTTPPLRTAGATAAWPPPISWRSHDEAVGQLVEWALLHTVLVVVMGLALGQVVRLLTALPLATLVRALGGG